jgi:hypothetical protein
MSSSHRNTGKDAVYTRQATILRKNLLEWDRMLRTPRGEDWSTMLGRLNAALNQTGSMDRSIEDLMEHFVYLPRKSTANAQDVPFFLSTRLETANEETAQGQGATDTTTGSATDAASDDQKQAFVLAPDPVRHLSTYENQAAQLAAEFDDNMVRF